MKLYVEIRSCAGGKEADLFADELMFMYLKYARKQNIKCEVLNDNKTKVILFEGKEELLRVFNNEKGVHRIQRASKTCSKGKIHTSTVSVAVIDVIESKKVDLNMDDIEITRCKASGAGGQHVNTTDSAVRVKHTPTGIVITCQNERSQHQNKAQALELLQVKLQLMSELDSSNKINSNRKNQVSHGERAESRRNYHYGRNEVVDQITGKRCKLNKFMSSADLKSIQ